MIKPKPLNAFEAAFVLDVASSSMSTEQQMVFKVALDHISQITTIHAAQIQELKDYATQASQALDTLQMSNTGLRNNNRHYVAECQRLEKEKERAIYNKDRCISEARRWKRRADNAEILASAVMEWSFADPKKVD